MRGQKNMSGIAAIKHSLRDVDSRPCKVRFVVNVPDSIDRAAMNAHPDLNVRTLFQGSADLKRTSHRLLWTAEKKERHPISHWHSIELAACFRRPKTFGASHNVIEVLQQFN